MTIIQSGLATAELQDEDKGGLPNAVAQFELSARKGPPRSTGKP